MKKIAFFIASDTLVYLCKPVLEKLFDKAEIYVLFPRNSQEKAEEVYKNLFPNNLSNICTANYAFKQKLDYLVCANDWGVDISLLIWLARRKGVTTAAIQESVVDLSINSDRYLFADVIYAQGDVSKELLRRNNVIVTGNPRYEDIHHQKAISKHALINCNFTYGLFEESKDKWLEDLIVALKGSRIKFKISKHPRDSSNLIGLEKHVINSGAGVIHAQLKEAAFLITRFSSLIHESILMGRPVIYYNPHREDMGYDFTPDNVILFMVHNKEDLKKAIIEIMNIGDSNKSFSIYIKKHLANQNSLLTPSQCISNELLNGNVSKLNNKRINIFKVILWLILRRIKKLVIRK